MKTIKEPTLLLVVMLILWSACSKDDVEKNKPAPPLLEVILSHKKVISPQNGITKQILIYTNVDLDKLTITEGDTWAICQLKKEENKIKLSVEANDNITSRSTKFIIKGEGVTDTLVVEQIGTDPAIIFVKKNIMLEDYKSRMLNIELQSNMDDLVVTLSDDWITSLPIKSLENYTFQFQVDQNESENERKAFIIFANQDGLGKDSIMVEQPMNPTAPHEPAFLMKHNLNVVYFIPNDIEIPSEYERRISELMIWARNFYAENMEKQGFGKRSFGLRTISKGRINLITVYGKNGHSSYPYEGGSTNVMREINAHFAEYPEKKESHHTLVIIPSYSGDPLKPGGPPFYGTGRQCFALDYEYMDIKYLGEDTQKGKLLTNWFGGLAHELGHGLNLPHNSQLASQINDPNFGTTLMGAGNSTLGLKPTFLSKASCALLNNCQVFATDELKEFYGSNTVKIEKFSIEHKATTINVRGKYKNASKPINAINIYIDDYPYSAANDNYDAESWCITNFTNNEFSIEIPLNELNTLKTNPLFRIRTWLLFEDGTRTEESHDFDRNDLKNYSFVAEIDMPRTGWEATTSSSQLPQHPPENLFDGEINSFWHSQYVGGRPDHPHIITVDIKDAKTIRGLSFVQRQTFQGAIYNFNLEISADGENWENAGTYELLEVARKQFIYLSEPKSVQKFKISTIDGKSDVGALAEIGAFE